VIRELRVLPPLAIARFGAAATPLDNYEAMVDPERPLGYRVLQPAQTLEVDIDSGEIVRSFVPERLSFTDNGKVRPVAPFLEVWALTDGGQLEPLTTELLAGEGASSTDLRWRVQVANHKVFRRTGDERDKVDADSGEFSDHTRRPLAGGCVNFWRGRTIPFGHVQYIRPTQAHPEIRLRFTPAAGFVYGASSAPPPEGPPTDPNLQAIVYDASPGRGRWLNYRDAGPATTAPGFIYAQDAERRSLGYLDDGCDGLVRVMLTVGDQTLSAYGRVGAGPPTYAPDALPVRTVADELEQALFGPTVSSAEATPETALERVEEIIRRAFETIRLMNTAAMNSSGMVFHDAGRGRRQDPIMAPSLVDTIALENLHQSLLVALRSGTAPWFADVLRDYDEIGDLSDRGRRKMPAMMRGADGQHLTLTRRQIDLIRTLVRGPIFPDAGRETT
jgi:hypothetical protein